jgi:hypothetical protein
MITGRAALKVFYDESYRLYGFKYFRSFDDFIAGLKNSPDRQYRILEESLDNAIEILSKDSFFSWGIDGKVKDAMIKLAKLSDGKLPSLTGFTMAISNKFSSLGLSDYKIIALNTLSDISTNVSNVGSGVMSLNKTMRYAIPIVGVLGLVLVVYSMTRKAR